MNDDNSDDIETVNDDNSDDIETEFVNAAVEKQYPPNVLSGDLVAIAYEKTFCIGICTKELKEGCREVVRVELLDQTENKIYKKRKSKKRSLDVQAEFIFQLVDSVDYDSRKGLISVINYNLLQKITRTTKLAIFNTICIYILLIYLLIYIYL